MYHKIESIEKWGSGGTVKYVTGEQQVKEIGEHLPAGPGDVCYYDVRMTDGSFVRIYYPDIVKYSKPVNLETPAKPSIIT